MKKNLLIVSVLFITILMYSAEIEVDNTEWTCDPLPYFYSNNRLSTVAAGRGYTGVADTGNLSLSTLNPAAFYTEKKFQFYMEYSAKNDIAFLKNYNEYSEFKKNKYGNIIGFGVNLDEFQGGLFFSQPKSYKFAMKVYYWDYYNNEETSSVLTAKQSQGSLTIPISYYFADMIRLGVNLDVSKFVSTDPDVMYYSNGSPVIMDGKVEFFMGRFKYGAVLFPEKNYSLGISFLPEVKKVIYADYGSVGNFKHKENSFPLELIVGGKYNPDFQFLRAITAFFDYKYSKNSGYDYITDRSDFHLGLEFKPEQRFVVRSGVFTQHEYRDMEATYVFEDQNGNEQEDVYWHDESNNDQIFVTLGASYIWKSFKVNIAYMNGSMLSTGDTKQGYFNMGFEFNFDNPNKVRQ
jgi:hypothetical protein